MSGNPTGSNVVPMPHVAAPAAAPPQMPMPMPGMWGGGGSLPWGPGCCPPGGMDALMKCYCDVQAATAFICSVMVQCIQQNPAVTAAIIAAIEASGSTLPLLGVTNGSDAQPGQVGEYVRFAQSVPFSGTAPTNVNLTMGVLQPGDWDIWAYTNPGFGYSVADITYELNPTPPGTSDAMGAQLVAAPTHVTSMVASNMVRGSYSVPTLMAISATVNETGTSAPGTLVIVLAARRRR